VNKHKVFRQKSIVKAQNTVQAELAEWNSLLTDEEKELLKDVRCSANLRTMHPEDVKIIIKHVREMASKSNDIGD